MPWIGNVAVVIFEIYAPVNCGGLERGHGTRTIDTPFGKSLCVKVFVAQTSRIASAGIISSTAVNSNLQAHVVNLPRGGIDAFRKLFEIGDNSMSRVVADFFGIAVVNVDILVTGILGKLSAL